MLGWLTITGLFLVMAILSDDWLATRYRRPLSHMKPDPRSLKGATGLEATDQTRANRQVARKKDQRNDR